MSPKTPPKSLRYCLPHDWLSWRIGGFGPVEDGEDAHLNALFTNRSDTSGTNYFDSLTNTYRYDSIDMALG
jgi:xylulokinase